MQEAVAKERRARRRAEHAADEARDEKDAAVMAAQRKLDSTEAALAARERWVAQLELRLEKEKREVREMYCVCMCMWYVCAAFEMTMAWWMQGREAVFRVGVSSVLRLVS